MVLKYNNPAGIQESDAAEITKACNQTRGPAITSFTASELSKRTGATIPEDEMIKMSGAQKTSNDNT